MRVARLARVLAPGRSLDVRPAGHDRHRPRRRNARRWAEDLPRHSLRGPAGGESAMAPATGRGEMGGRARGEGVPGRACLQTNAAISNLPAPSEDCLFVNVWTPARDGGRLPVMVWIHGGGFVAGTPAEQLYHGEWLAKKGVVVVSVGYRLGVFGFLAHPRTERRERSPCVRQLRSPRHGCRPAWVQKNIAAFGGDPQNVTIFGESAGAIAVSQLAVSPLAKGLFQRAISESGGSFGPVRAGGGPGENMQPLAPAREGRCGVGRLHRRRHADRVARPAGREGAGRGPASARVGVADHGWIGHPGRPIPLVRGRQVPRRAGADRVQLR